MEYQAEIGNHKYFIESVHDELFINKKKQNISFSDDEREYKIFKENRIHQIIIVENNENEITLLINNKEVKVSVKDRIHLTLERLGINTKSEKKYNDVLAPMPGVILDILIKTGQHVEKGQPLLVLEAMKMENIIKATMEGEITKISVDKLDTVEKNTQLLTIQ